MKKALKIIGIILLVLLIAGHVQKLLESETKN